MRRVCWIAVVAVIALGCDSADHVKHELPLDQLCDAILEAYCERRLECFSAAELEYHGYASHPECVEALQPFCTEECNPEEEPFCAFRADTWQPAVDAGRLVYHPERAAECFAALRKTPCMDSVAWTFGVDIPEACLGALEGLVEPDGDCQAWTLECMGEGMWCEPHDWPDAGCLSGTCQPLRKVGESCSGYAGETCEFDLYCVSMVCRPPSDLGEPCWDGESGGCKTGLYCGTDDETCHELVRLGEPCDTEYGDPCQFHGHCHEGICTGQPRVGESCSGDLPTADCWLGWCDGAVQALPGICMPLPEIGDECDGEFKRCRDGRCDWAQFPAVCVAFKPLGEACEGNSECKSLRCHPSELVCVEDYCPED